MSWLRADRQEGGATVIEFAVLLPVLVLLTFGIVEFGRGYNAKVSLTAAVREGVRVLALGEDDPAVIEQTTRDAAPSLDPAAITVTSSAVPCSAGSQASVTASIPFTYDIPLFGSDSVALETTGVMRCGG